MVRGDWLVRKRVSKVCWPAAARSNSETLLLAQPCSCREGHGFQVCECRVLLRQRHNSRQQCNMVRVSTTAPGEEDEADRKGTQGRAHVGPKAISSMKGADMRAVGDSGGRRYAAEASDH